MKLIIPKHITLFYTTNFLILQTVNEIKFIKIKTKIDLSLKTAQINITNHPINSNKKFINYKSLKLFKKTLYLILNNITKSLKYKGKQTLKIVGIGFRVIIEKYNKIFNILQFKLGYSHSVNIIYSNRLKISCSKKNKLMISGNNTKTVNNLASLIRSYKTPEFYKGKGILYENEIIKIKEGKKL